MLPQLSPGSEKFECNAGRGCQLFNQPLHSSPMTLPLHELHRIRRMTAAPVRSTTDQGSPALASILASQSCDSCPSSELTHARTVEVVSTLIILDFAEQGDAQSAYERIHELNGAAVLTLVGAALIAVDAAGQVVMTKASFGKADKARAVQSAAFGLILGSLVLAPVLGFAAGGVIGDVFTAQEKNDDHGDPKFRRRVTESVRSGHWIVALYAVEVAHDELARQLASFGGTMFISRLSAEDDLALAAVLGAQE